MTEAKGSSRRRLAFTSPPVSQCIACSLCSQQHVHLSSPNSWKDEDCQHLALSLGISGHSFVCRPCRNDISRLKTDPSHCPRWEKNKISGCAIPQCKNTFFSKCYLPIPDITQCLTVAGENIPTNLDTVLPLCKHHYLVVYNTYKPKQTRCPTCGTGLHKQNTRTCPDVASISMYLAEKTGYEGTLKEDDKVCFSCYKFHLHILKCIEKESTDTVLDGLIEGIKHTILKPEQVVSVDDAVSRAMSITTVHVGETLLRQEGLLLPAVHNFFIQKINECIPKDREQCFTARWVLSNLKTSLQQHLSYFCKIKKCGTLLYRSNGDTLVALTNALYKMSRLTNVTSTHGNEGEGKCEAQSTDSMQIALNDVNSAMHEQIQVFLKGDARCPYRFDKMDINSLILQINPTLWEAICSITQ